MSLHEFCLHIYKIFYFKNMCCWAKCRRQCALINIKGNEADGAYRLEQACSAGTPVFYSKAQGWSILSQLIQECSQMRLQEK